MAKITETRHIIIEIGVHEDFKTAVTRARKQVDIVPDNVELIKITIYRNKNAHTEQE